jgi:hypothetical protein
MALVEKKHPKEEIINRIAKLLPKVRSEQAQLAQK